MSGSILSCHRPEEHFLHIQIDSSTNFEEMRDGFCRAQSSGGNSGRRGQVVFCQEVRISVVENALGPYNVDGETTSTPPEEHRHENDSRVSHFVSMLQALLLAEPAIEKLTFDSGFTSASNSLPVDAISVVLTDAKALKRLDLSYVQITCHSEEQLDSWKTFFQNTKETKIGTHNKTLKQCCLDRCSLVVLQNENQNDADDHQEISLDALIDIFVLGFPELEWLTICSDGFKSLSTETLVHLCEAPSLQELMLWNFDLQADPHLMTTFDTLSRRPSQLVRLTLPTTLSLSGAQTVASYLRLCGAAAQPAPSDDYQRHGLEGLTLTVNQFVKDSNEAGGSIVTTHDEKDIDAIINVIADALANNQSLQSFRLRGSAKIPPTCMEPFAKALVHNYTLQYFSILNVSVLANNSQTNSASSQDTTSTSNIQIFLKLNRHGRRQLLVQNTASNSNSKTNIDQWVDALIDLRNDLNCLFYLLQTNPSLCHVDIQ